MVRRWLEARARELDVRLEFADSPQQVLGDVHGTTPPDCVILDACSSSDGDATPLWRRLRRSTGPRVPILLYSSSSRWQGVADTARDAVDGVLSRPFDPDTLLDAARRVSASMAA